MFNDFRRIKKLGKYLTKDKKTIYLILIVLLPVSFSGENFDIAFIVRYLLEGLIVIASENVILKCNIATTPAVFVPEDNLNSFTYLVMPVQVRS